MPDLLTYTCTWCIVRIFPWIKYSIDQQDIVPYMYVIHVYSTYFTLCAYIIQRNLSMKDLWGHPFNQDTFCGPKGVPNREVPLYTGKNTVDVYTCTFIISPFPNMIVKWLFTWFRFVIKVKMDDRPISARARLSYVYVYSLIALGKGGIIIVHTSMVFFQGTYTGGRTVQHRLRYLADLHVYYMYIRSRGILLQHVMWLFTSWFIGRGSPTQNKL